MMDSTDKCDFPLYFCKDNNVYMTYRYDTHEQLQLELCKNIFIFDTTLVIFYLAHESTPQ